MRSMVDHLTRHCSITRRPHTTPTVLFTLLSLLTALSVLPTRNSIDAQAAPLVRVVRVIDGDTIEVCCIGWKRESVRYIGIDTPETQHPSKGVEAYGKEAKEANHRLVAGKTVHLEFDVQRRDQYGRLLAYVYLEDGTFVNAWLVEHGYAQVITVPPNVKYQELFLKLQHEARTASRGLWR